VTRNRPLQITTVSANDFLEALHSVRGHLKAASMLWMHLLGLPLLSGVIVRDWSKESQWTVQRFCRIHGFREVLLRIDRRGQRWTSRRGGYLVPVAHLGKIVAQLRRESTLAILLEPASPYADRYSLAAVTLPEQDTITVEVVGPGFDASDILRGDTQPHERIQVSAPLRQPGLKRLEPSDCQRTYIIGPGEYRKTVEQRLIKIGARLKDPSFPTAVLAASQSDQERLRDSALAFLRESRQTVLLRHQEIYTPISTTYVLRFVRGVANLLAGLASYGVHLGSTSFSGSFIGNGRLVFWDFFPASSREASVLYLSAGPPTS